MTTRASASSSSTSPPPRASVSSRPRPSLCLPTRRRLLSRARLRLSVSFIFTFFPSPRPGRVRPTARGDRPHTRGCVPVSDRPRRSIETASGDVPCRDVSGLTLTSHHSSMRPGTGRDESSPEATEPTRSGSDRIRWMDATRAWTGASTRQRATRRVTETETETETTDERCEGTNRNRWNREND